MPYVSTLTQFLRQLKSDRPEIEADQAQGRRIWWDKPPIDMDQRRRDLAASVPQKPYPYQTGPEPRPGDVADE